MTTFVRLYLSSAAFGTSLAVIYFIWSHGEWAGTILLGMMAIGLTFAAGYAIVSERDADLVADCESEDSRADGEDLGVYTTRSHWPILLAFCILMQLIGAIWIPYLLYAGLLSMLLILWRLGVESSRTS